MKKLIKFSFFLYLILFPFGQLTRLPLGNLFGPEVHLYLTDIVLFFLLLSWGVWRFGLERKKYQLPPLAMPIFLFFIFSLLSLGIASPLLSNREVLVASLYLLRWMAYMGLYFVISDLKKYWLKESTLLNFLIIVGGAMAVFGFAQYLFWPNLKPFEFFHWDPHFYRLVSTFLDPGFTGLILVLTLIILVNLFPEKKGNKWLVIGILITCPALLLTHSRSSYLALLVSMGLISWLRKKIKLFIVVLIILLFSLAILPQPEGEGGKLLRTYTINYRLESWQSAIAIIKDHPLFGVGFNAYRYVQRDYGFLKGEDWQLSHAGAGTDSSLLFVLATTGIFGLTAYLWYLFKALSLSYSRKKRAIGIICFSSLGAILIHSCFLNSLLYPWIISWLGILLALL